MKQSWNSGLRWPMLGAVVAAGLGVMLPLQAKEVGTEDSIRIAFGSCNHQDLPQPLWKDILSEDPHFWIWLGDNIYGDTEDMTVLREKYERNKAQPDYVRLRQRAEVHGTWDDHDYGVNDGGREYPMKAASKRELARFLDLPDTHEIFSGRECITTWTASWRVDFACA